MKRKEAVIHGLKAIAKSVLIANGIISVELVTGSIMYIRHQLYYPMFILKAMFRLHKHDMPDGDWRKAWEKFKSNINHKK